MEYEYKTVNLLLYSGYIQAKFLIDNGWQIVNKGNSIATFKRKIKK